MDLTTQWKQTGELLEIEYRFRNPTDQRVLVFTHLFHTEPTGERRIDPGLAFVAVDRNGHLSVALQVPELPEDLDIEFPIVPYAELVPPGGETTGKVILTLPLKINIAYPQLGVPPTPDRTRTAELRIGYMQVTTEEIPAKEISFDERTLYSVRHNLTVENQRISASGSRSLDVTVANQPVTP